MDSKVKAAVTVRVGAFRHRVAWVFCLQFLAVTAACAMGKFQFMPLAPIVALIAATNMLAWIAIRREWKPVHALARMVSPLAGQRFDLDALQLDDPDAPTDADVVTLMHGLRGYATRIVGYDQRERNFTRDASHELRSPLTIIKMSIDMLSDEEDLSDFGRRSISRIQRASREMEALVEALLVLARDQDSSIEEERFVVNDVLRQEIEFAREMLVGQPVELALEEPERFALQGSPRVLSVLLWQLIRNACQQIERGRVVVTVIYGVVVVANHAHAAAAETGNQDAAAGPYRRADRHGFELAIAQRISDRFSWPLELQSDTEQNHVARIRFPHPLAIEEAVGL
ncbi:MAG: HAMP domain-containing histidine kinase [Rhodanobacter sp.]|nr:MAG: HAMP domain-containing histidine kinase [Rhodanobacter sp.]